jgi:oligopeptidase B
MSSSGSSLAAFAGFGVASLASSILLKARVRALSTAPRAKRVPYVVKIGKTGPASELSKRGTDVSKLIDPPIHKEDDLYWLRDDTRSKPEVLEHLRAENAYTGVLTAHLTRPGGPVDTLYEEFRSRMKETDSAVPVKRGPFVYYSRTVKGLSYPIHCRSIVGSGEEEVLLDENAIAKGNPMTDIHAVEETSDHSLLAYSVDFTGYETYNIHFKQLKNQAVYPAGVNPDDADIDVVGVAGPATTTIAGLDDIVIKNTNGDIEWGPEISYTNDEGKAIKARTCYYMSMDPEHRPYRVWRHILGRPQEKDECIYEEKDERFWLDISTSQSGDYLFLTSASKITSEVHAIPLTARAVATLTKAGAKPAAHVKGAVPDLEDHKDDDEEEDEEDEGEQKEGEEESGDEEEEDETKPDTAGDGAPLPLMQLIAKRQDNVLFEVEHYRYGKEASKGSEDVFVINTNKDGAKNFNVAFVPVTDLAKGSSAWREILPHSTAIYVEDVSVFKSFWVVSGRQGGYENVWLVAQPDIEKSISTNGATPLKMSMIPPREGVYTLSVGGGNAEYHANTLRFIYSSPVTPTLSCEVAVTDGTGKPVPLPRWPSGEIKSATGDDTDPLAPLPTVPQDGTILVLKQKPVPNITPSLYRTVRLFAPSKDGKTKIPISLVVRPDRHALHKAEAEKLFSTAPGSTPDADSVGCPLVEPAPILLYAYGSYGYSMPASFSAHVLSMCDRGVLYAIAHVRGGTEMGRSWYEDEGKLLTKRNTFEDYCAVADYLISKGWTKKGKIGAQGGSAGGLLMGVVANERPELFGAVLAEVPFVDVLTTMSDPSIPLTVGEYEEWGSPNQSDYYPYIKSYSPIDNVRKQVYPPMLLEGGLNDCRVAYWEPAKHVQRLRDVNIPVAGPHSSEQHNTILLKTEMAEGHAGAADRYKYLKEKAFSWSWLLDKLGVSV